MTSRLDSHSGRAKLLPRTADCKIREQGMANGKLIYTEEFEA